MLTPFADTAVKQYAPAVQPKKILAPGEIDPDAKPDEPIGALPASPIQGTFAPADTPSTYAPVLQGSGGPLASPPVPDVPTPTAGSNPIALGDPAAPGPTPTAPATPAGQQVFSPQEFAPTIDLGRADQDSPEPSKPGFIWHHNGHAWELRPAGGTATPATTDPTKPPPTPTGPAEPAPTGPVLSPQEFAPSIDLGKADQDSPEPNKPGYVWHHNGHAWELRPAGSAGAPGAPGGGGAPAPLSLQDTLNQKMLNLMNRSEVPTRDDPALAGALAANRLSEQRGAERARAMLAEQAAREGGGASSGALRTAMMGINEGRAAREGQYEGDTIMQEVVQRRNQLQQVMTLAGDMLTAEQKNALDRELGHLNAEVQRYGISEGGRQADAGLAEKIREFDLDEAFRRAGLDASTASAGASRSESARQFDINQAQQQAQWEAEFNRQSFLDLLNAYGY